MDPPVPSSLSDSYVLLSIHFSNTVDLSSSLKATHTHTHIHKITGKVILLCVLISETKDCEMNVRKHYQNLIH
jgi:hypothetical protein